ncbi:MAG: hypothetical protein D6712_03170 [Chloroflexi bacterium]|nr:MAG: hypothetical protein D6712_03170 [Chloroflexota bacterium]
MSFFNNFDSDVVIHQGIAPATQGSLNTGWIAPFVNDGANRAVFLLDVGTLGAGVTIDMKLEQATDSSGTGAKDITGAVITQVTDTTDERVRTIEIAPNALDDINGYTYVRAVVTVAGGTGTAPYGVLALSRQLREPGNTTSGSDWDEAVFVTG